MSIAFSKTRGCTCMTVHVTRKAIFIIVFLDQDQRPNAFMQTGFSLAVDRIVAVESPIFQSISTYLNKLQAKFLSGGWLRMRSDWLLVARRMGRGSLHGIRLPQSRHRLYEPSSS